MLRLVPIVGTLSFARDRDTELNVSLIKVQNSDTCSESGFSSDFSEVNAAGEPGGATQGEDADARNRYARTTDPAEHTARIRLHHLEGMNKDDAPALVCCSAQMDLQGAPMNRTWSSSAPM